MLAGSFIQGTISNYQNGMTKRPEKPLIFGRNPVSCHGNKPAELIVWSTFSRIFLQRIKHF